MRDRGRETSRFKLQWGERKTRLYFGHSAASSLGMHRTRGNVVEEDMMEKRARAEGRDVLYSAGHQSRLSVNGVRQMTCSLDAVRTPS